MSKNVKCYNYKEVIRMLGLVDGNNLDKVQEFIDMLKEHDLEIFQPPFMKYTSGPVRRPLYYIKTNKYFDEYMKQQNTWAVLKGKRPVKPGYRKYSKPREDTDTVNGMFIFV